MNRVDSRDTGRSRHSFPTTGENKSDSLTSKILEIVKKIREYIVSHFFRPPSASPSASFKAANEPCLTQVSNFLTAALEEYDPSIQNPTKIRTSNGQVFYLAFEDKEGMRRITLKNSSNICEFMQESDIPQKELLLFGAGFRQEEVFPPFNSQKRGRFQTKFSEEIDTPPKKKKAPGNCKNNLSEAIKYLNVSNLEKELANQSGDTIPDDSEINDLIGMVGKFCLRLCDHQKTALSILKIYLAKKPSVLQNPEIQKCLIELFSSSAFIFEEWIGDLIHKKDANGKFMLADGFFMSVFLNLGRSINFNSYPRQLKVDEKNDSYKNKVISIYTEILKFRSDFKENLKRNLSAYCSMAIPASYDSLMREEFLSQSQWNQEFILCMYFDEESTSGNTNNQTKVGSSQANPIGLTIIPKSTGSKAEGENGDDGPTPLATKTSRPSENFQKANKAQPTLSVFIETNEILVEVS